MDAAAVNRIRANFDLLAPKADALVDVFYQKLFAGYPQVQSLFPKDMTSQKKHLLAAVTLVVKNADKLPTLERPLMDMGARHVKYGTKPEHYPIVRDTMLSAMKTLAGSAWTNQLEADWTAALNAVAQTMLKGAEQAAKNAA